MNIYLKHKKTKQLIKAQIIKANVKDFPENWQFRWKKLYNKESMFYKIVLENSPEVLEGLLMVTLLNSEMMYLNNIEVAPHNYGKNGTYDFVAGCMFAFACNLSLIYAKGYYKGYLVFDSKTKLIEYYQQKYGAVLLSSQRMCIDKDMGIKLIKQYLGIEEINYE